MIKIYSFYLMKIFLRMITEGAEVMADDNVKNQINDIALQYAGLLKEHIGLHSLYVYGSYASGTFTDDSDIAVVADGFSGDLVEDTFKLMKIRRNMDNRIEALRCKAFFEFDFLSC